MLRVRLAIMLVVLIGMVVSVSSVFADSNLHIVEGVLTSCTGCQEDGSCDGYFFTYAPNNQYNAFEAKILPPASSQCVAWTAAFEWHHVRFTFWLGREDVSPYETVIRGNHLQDLGQVASP